MDPSRVRVRDSLRDIHVGKLRREVDTPSGSGLGFEFDSDHPAFDIPEMLPGRLRAHRLGEGKLPEVLLPPPEHPPSGKGDDVPCGQRGVDLSEFLFSLEAFFVRERLEAYVVEAEDVLELFVTYPCMYRERVLTRECRM